MIGLPSGVRVWIAAGHTDMRRGMQGLARQVQEVLHRDPHAGDLYVFRGRSGSLVKILWHDGVGMSLYAKRCEAAGARPVRLADACGQRRRFDLCLAACLHAGRHRLEKSPADLSAALCRLSCRCSRLWKLEPVGACERGPVTR
jgi:transposase